MIFSSGPSLAHEVVSLKVFSVLGGVESGVMTTWLPKSPQVETKTSRQHCFTLLTKRTFLSGKV